MKRYSPFFEGTPELFYNYRRNKKELDEEVIFCANNPYSSRHYGDYQRIFKATKKTLDLRKKGKEKKALERYYIEWLKTAYPNGSEGANLNFEDNINPTDIVDSAGVWDSIDFINYLYDYTPFYNDHDGVVTNNGAIFFEVTRDNLVSLKKLNPEEENW